MAKRKRATTEDDPKNSNGKTRRIAEVITPSTATHIHLITGSYERALHGIIATIPPSILNASNTVPILASNTETNDIVEVPKEPVNGHSKPAGKDLKSQGLVPNGQKNLATQEGEDVGEVIFADSFLFNAHTSAIRCLALSPIPKPTDAQQKVILATGSTDERVNLYHICPSPPPPSPQGHSSLPSLSGASISQNPRNKELGSLLHHSSSITALYFPTRSKLISAAEDNTIAVSRTRDWNVLSTIKAPIPKPVGRPSGDTAGPGEVPAGVNDFAVHPSMKLMVSVGKGERCMRLWNLVTGKKAGVLNFEKDVLQQVGEGRFGTSEGRRILWDQAGEEFAVGFERGICVYDIECKPKVKICPTPLTKVHQMHYVPGMEQNVIAVSTEDGRILFYDTNPKVDYNSSNGDEKSPKTPHLPEARLVAQLGGPAADMTTRIKDFEILNLPPPDDTIPTPAKTIIVTAGSDGTIRLWFLSLSELQPLSEEKDDVVLQVGQFLAKYDTGNRITCLKAFVMTQRLEQNGDTGEGEEEWNGFEDVEVQTDSDESE